MELQIQDLVSSIRKDGLDAANKESEAIISEAKKRAETIISDAKTEAQSVKEASAKEIEVMKGNAAAGIEQAKRDAVLSFKASVQEEFEKILAAKVKESFSSDALGKLIKAAVANEDIASYSVELSEVSEALKASLAEELQKGLKINVSKDVQAGFRLASNDGSGYFDCTDEEVTSMLMPYFRNLEF